MASLAIFKPSGFYQKYLEVKSLFNFELRKSVSSMADEKKLMKNDWIKNTPSINIPCSSKVGTKTKLNDMFFE